MTIALAIACLILAASTFYFWRKSMTVNDLVAKVAAANSAADGAVAKIATLTAENAGLSANQADPAVLGQIADGLDAITAKLS